MARIRTLKPEFWQDEKLAPLPAIDRLVFIGLISQADDAGRLVDNPRMLDGLIFPHTDESCRQSLETLNQLGRIIRYKSDSGQKLIQIVGWKKHQNVQKPSSYVLPEPPNGKSGHTPETPKSVPGDIPSPIPDPRPTIPTDTLSNESDAKTAAPPVDNSLEDVNDWLAYFMPIARANGFEADRTDGSILKAMHKKKYPAADVEAAIRGTARMKAAGKLSAWRDRKLSMELLYARPKPDAPPDRRPLWNKAVELYHAELERSSRSDPNAGNAIGEVLRRMQTGAA